MNRLHTKNDAIHIPKYLFLERVALENPLSLEYTSYVLAKTQARF